MYRNVSSLIKACDELNLPIWELMIRSEMKYARATRQEVWDKMKNQLQVMENAAHRGADGNGVDFSDRINRWRGCKNAQISRKRKGIVW